MSEKVSCDACGSAMSQENAIRRDFGHVPIAVEMNGLSFCTKSCEHEHIGRMLQNPLLPHETREQLSIEAPLIACGLSTCSKNKNKTAATATGPTKPAPEPATVAADTSDAQDPIEAPAFLTKIRRAVNSKEWIVDLEAIAKDLSRRALWFASQGGGIQANKTAIRGQGDALKAVILNALVAKGFPDKAAAAKTLQLKYEEAMNEEANSKQFIGPPQITKMLTKPTWSDKVLVEEWAIVLRRSMDTANNPKPVHHAQLAVDTRRILRRTIELAGLAGYDFLKLFLFDLESSLMLEKQIGL